MCLGDWHERNHESLACGTLHTKSRVTSGVLCVVGCISHASYVGFPLAHGFVEEGQAADNQGTGDHCKYYSLIGNAIDHRHLAESTKRCDARAAELLDVEGQCMDHRSVSLSRTLVLTQSQATLPACSLGRHEQLVAEQHLMRGLSSKPTSTPIQLGAAQGRWVPAATCLVLGHRLLV